MYYGNDIHFNTFLSAMRKGKNVTLERLAWGLCSISMLGRIESGERLPDKMMRDRLMDRLGIVNDGFEDFLPPAEYALWKERQDLLQAIENKDLDTADKLIRQYEMNGVSNNAIEHQFYLAMKIQLMQYQNDPEEELREVLKQAISLTIPESSMDRWNGRLLAVQEWNLLLEYIRCGGDVGTAREKGRNTAGKLPAYEKILEAIQKSSMDTYSCAKIYPKAVYYLCLEWMSLPVSDWDCRRMYDLAEKALEMLRSISRMYYLCEVLEIMERVLSVWIGRSDMTDEETRRLRPMMAQVQEWRRVLSEVFEGSKVSEKMESCGYLYQQMQNYRIGDVVRKRRKMLGLSAKALCQGICSEKTLRRLENNRNGTHMEIVGELLGRLGLAAEYQRKRIITDRYEAMVLYSKAAYVINNRDMETLGKILPELRSMLSMDILDNRQEMDCLETIYLWHCNQITNEESISRLQQVIEYTVPLKHVINMEEGFLSGGEISCLYNIAIRAKGAAESTYMSLLQKICNTLAEENGMMIYSKMYELIMYKIASYLGDVGEYTRSNKISNLIMETSLLLRRMNMLHMCVYNNLWNKRENIAKNTSADCKVSIKEDSMRDELQKCFQLAKLCKDIMYEDFYHKKLSQLYARDN